MVNWWKTLHWCWASYIFSSSQKWFHHEFFSKKTDVHLGAQYELGFLNCLLQFCFPFNSGYLFGLLLFSSLNIWPQYGNLIIMTFHDGIVENIPKLPLTCHYYQLFASFPNQLISESEKTFEFVLINKLFYKSWKSYLLKLDSPTSVDYLEMAQKVIEDFAWRWIQSNFSCRAENVKKSLSNDLANLKIWLYFWFLSCIVEISCSNDVTSCST